MDDVPSMPLGMMLDFIPEIHEANKVFDDKEEYVDFWNILDTVDESKPEQKAVESIDVDEDKTTFDELVEKSESIVAKIQLHLAQGAIPTQLCNNCYMQIQVQVFMAHTDVCTTQKLKLKVDKKKKKIVKNIFGNEDNKCTSCDRKFLKEASLNMHMESCSKKKPAGKTREPERPEGDVETTVEKVKENMVNNFLKDEISKEHKCTSCDKKFLRENTLKLHIESCSKLKSVLNSIDESQQEGDYAGINTKVETVFVSTQGENSPNTCTICQKKLSTEKNFKIHIKACMNPEQKIDIKLWNFKSGSKRKPCGFCPGCLKFCGECVHCREMPQFGGNNPNRYACQKRKYLCTNFERINFIENKFIKNCKYCGKEFDKPLLSTDFLRANSNAKIHMRICKNKYEIASLPCKLCGNKYRDRRLLYSHMRRYHQKPFKCDSCSFGCGSNYDLTKHKNYKHKGAVFTCKTCEKDLAYERNYKRHMEEVHGDLKLVCDKCGHSTTTQYNLDKHNDNMHSDSTLDCTLCTRKFHSKKRLKAHHKYSHEGLLKCDQCSLTANHQSTLKKHKERSHEGKTFPSEPDVEVGGRVERSVEKKVRATWSPEQLVTLEEHYQGEQHMELEAREGLATRLGLKEERVKVWFKNRRARNRREPRK